MKYQFKMLEGECWWGGSAMDGMDCPLTAQSEFVRDYERQAENQTMPMFLSNKGRCLWSEDIFKVEVKGGVFTFDSVEEVVLESFGSTLRDAFLGAMKKHFPISGNELPELFFSVPQYNTWMQHTYDPTEEKVLKYAHEIIENGFTPGILIIDEGWQKEYGLWEFDQVKFPNPKRMIDELHALGFIVMLWLVPSVRPDGFEFVKRWQPSMNPESHDKLFLRNKEGKVVLSRWWNGYSASFDMTKEADRKLLDTQLQSLIRDCGVDGFKFDGGRYEHYTDYEAVNGPVETSHTAAERNIAWNEFGTRYPFHEYKDTFKGGGKRSIQRICDRGHSWGENGLASLIPTAILEGIIGHPFVCPDMIGGGSWTVRALNKPVDEELFVRMAQCSALFPMMQFSWAPWEAVGKESLAYIKAAHDLHISYSEKILTLVNQAYRDGEPIIRSLAYNYPGGGYEGVHDQFMLGEDILVAPVIVKGETVKRVHLPEGVWIDSKGETFVGGKTLDYPVTIADLPVFTKK